MRVIVCGSRDYNRITPMYPLLNGLSQPLISLGFEFVVISGAANGADSLAADWAERTIGATSLEFPAQWNVYGKRAGYIRNQQMLDEGKPDLVVAFYGLLPVDRPLSKGTAMMCDIAREAGVEVWEIFS